MSGETEFTGSPKNVVGFHAKAQRRRALPRFYVFSFAPLRLCVKRLLTGKAFRKLRTVPLKSEGNKLRAAIFTIIQQFSRIAILFLFDSWTLFQILTL
jgi:hypothetical protein